MNKIVSIIPAAGRPNNSILEHSSLPDTMIPINGKPVLGYILEDIIERGIKKTIIIIHSDDVHTEKYIKLNYSEKIKITILKSKKNRGVGYSVYLANNFIKKTDGILIYLGDTIYKGKLNFTNNFLVTSNTFEESKKWCFVEENKTKFTFINKPQYYKGKGKILCGIYFFKSGNKFKKTLSEAKNKQKIIEMSDLIKNYQEKSKNFVLKKANKWYDCGNIENYYLAKTDFLRIRSFNKIKYNQKYGIITKSSTNNKKIIDEINWYLKIPNELKIFTPRLFNFNKNIPNYSIEYYGYPSLADLYIFSYINLKIWNSILNRLFEVIKLFKKYKKNISYKTFTYIYTNKTLDRIKKLKNDKNWNKLLNKKYIYINGKKLKNLPFYFEKIDAISKIFYKKNDFSVIHGDMCLSNILYDVNSKSVKFIDPRGNFGKEIIYGDIKYDLAKLRHSFNGKYEFIISDLFKLTEINGEKFVFKIYSDNYHESIKNKFDDLLKKYKYDLNTIKLIESLLFISMIPLHDGKINRQKAMYLKSILLLNETNL